MQSSPLELGHARPLLNSAPFRRLWIAQFCATAAVYGLSLAAVVRVEEQAQSTAWTAVVILSAMLPAFLGSLAAGPVVDGLGRVRVLRASHLGRALVALAFWGAAMLLPPQSTLFAVFATNGALAVLTQFAMPAEFSLLPDLVGQPYLVPANTLLQLTWLIAEGLGVILLGPLVIKIAGVPIVGLLGAALCLLSLTLVLALPPDKAGASRATGRRRDGTILRSELRAGWQAIASDPTLLLVAAQATVAAVMLLMLMSLVPGLTSRHLGLHAEDAPFMILPGGVGFVLGSILVNRWEPRLSRLGWIRAGLIGAGIGVLLMAALSGSAFAVPLLLVPILGTGLALALVVIPSRTVLQEYPPAPVRGRVIAAQLAVANGTVVLALLLGGALADQLGIRPTMGLLGLATMGAAALGLRHGRSSSSPKD